MMHYNLLHGNDCAIFSRSSLMNLTAQHETRLVPIATRMAPAQSCDWEHRETGSNAPKCSFTQFLPQLVFADARAPHEARLGTQVVERKSARRGALGRSFEDAVHNGRWSIEITPLPLLPRPCAKLVAASLSRLRRPGSRCGVGRKLRRAVG
jgi:hypothetical protein